MLGGGAAAADDDDDDDDYCLPALADRPSEAALPQFSPSYYNPARGGGGLGGEGLGGGGRRRQSSGAAAAQAAAVASASAVGGPVRWVLSRFTGRWIFRLVAGVLVLEVVLHLTQLVPGSQCSRYDGVNAAGQFRLWGRSFNFTQEEGTPLPFSGRGVVMTASGNITRQAVGAFVTALVIREVLLSDIPIIIYYSGQGEEFRGPVRAAIDSLRGPPVNVTDLVTALEEEAQRRHLPLSLVHPPRPKVLRSYAAKVYALLASPFRDNILLDAGAVPFVSPDKILDLPSYVAHGLAIFSDYVELDKSKWANVVRQLCLDWKTVLQAFGGRELDSSCVVLDKSRNLDALMVAVALNGELQHKTYEELIGDKDTFGLAMLHVGKQFSVAGLEPGYLLLEREKNKARKVSGHLQFLRDPAAPYGLVPIHHNNQLLDFREFPHIANRTYMEVFSVLGDVLMPVNRRRDCRPFHPRDLKELGPHMKDAYAAIAKGLAAAGLDHCACRDDWISCEQENARRRRKSWVYHVIDSLSPRTKPKGFIDPLPPGTMQ